MQPNFETLKTIIYREITGNYKFNPSLLGGDFINFNEKVKNAKKEINKILDNMDIRAVQNLPEKLKSKFPKWFIDNKYYIDYNESGNLDFIKHSAQ